MSMVRLIARLACLLALIWLAGCGEVVFITAAVLTAPLRQAKVNAANQHFSASGQVVDEAGRPMDGIDAGGSTVVTAEGPCFSIRPVWSSAKTEVCGSTFTADAHGSHLLVCVGKPGYYDYRALLYQPDRRRPQPPSRPAQPGLPPIDVTFAKRHVRQLRVVLRKHAPSRLARYEGELEYQPGPAMTGATCQGDPPRFTFGQLIPRQNTWAGGTVALAVNSDGPAATQPIDIGHIDAWLVFPGRVAFVAPPPGEDPLAHMVWAPPMCGADGPWSSGSHNQLNDYGHPRQLPNGDRQFFFYFRARGKYGKGLLTLHQPKPTRATASLILLVQEDGSRNLDEPPAPPTQANTP